MNRHAQKHHNRPTCRCAEPLPDAILAHQAEHPVADGFDEWWKGICHTFKRDDSMADISEKAYTAGQAARVKPDTVSVDKASLLKVVRRLDLDNSMSAQEFNAAFDDLRAVFTTDEIATGQIAHHEAAVLSQIKEKT